MKTIILVEPFTSVMVSYPAILIHRKRYQELVEFEMKVLRGGL